MIVGDPQSPPVRGDLRHAEPGRVNDVKHASEVMMQPHKVQIAAGIETQPAPSKVRTPKLIPISIELPRASTKASNINLPGCIQA